MRSRALKISLPVSEPRSTNIEAEVRKLSTVEAGGLTLES